MYDFCTKSINKSFIELLKFNNYEVKYVLKVKLFETKISFRHLDVVHCKISKLLEIFKYLYYLCQNILKNFISLLFDYIWYFNLNNYCTKVIY